MSSVDPLSTCAAASHLPPPSPSEALNQGSSEPEGAAQEGGPIAAAAPPVRLPPPPLIAAADDNTQALLRSHPKPSGKPKQTLGLANDVEEHLPAQASVGSLDETRS